LSQFRLLTLKIKRFHKEKDPSVWTQTFEVESRKGMNLLEGLLRIQDEQDPSLAFRYSCRGAVCGSCAMRVNGQIVLACRTSVEGLLGKPVLIEPLPARFVRRPGEPAAGARRDPLLIPRPSGSGAHRIRSS
jgi:succinate dehydrogenase/fumarate reductase iron-sulfur protein